MLGLGFFQGANGVRRCDAVRGRIASTGVEAHREEPDMVSWSTHAGAPVRRAGVAFLIAAAVAVLAACGSGTQDKTTGGSSTSGGGPKVTLTLKSITDA